MTKHSRTKHPRKWSGEVTRHSDALDLEQDVFKSDSPRRIARSLKKSAEKSHRRKASPYHSAMSMLTFYMNRAGRNLPDERKAVLEALMCFRRAGADMILTYFARRAAQWLNA